MEFIIAFILIFFILSLLIYVRYLDKERRAEFSNKLITIRDDIGTLKIKLYMVSYGGAKPIFLKGSDYYTHAANMEKLGLYSREYGDSPNGSDTPVPDKTITNTEVIEAILKHLNLEIKENKKVEERLIVCPKSGKKNSK